MPDCPTSGRRHVPWRNKLRVAKKGTCLQSAIGPCTLTKGSKRSRRATLASVNSANEKQALLLSATHLPTIRQIRTARKNQPPMQDEGQSKLDLNSCSYGLRDGHSVARRRHSDTA